MPQHFSWYTVLTLACLSAFLGTLCPSGADAADRPNIALYSPNLARAAKVRQSTTHEPARFSAAMAIDGNLETFTHTIQVAGSWLELDLGATVPLALIAVHNRKDCCGDRLNAAKVTVSAVPCDASPQSIYEAPLGPVAKPLARIEPPAGTSGRYICIRNPAFQPLSVGEVEVFSRLPTTARQSSEAFGGSAARAIDGNTNSTWAGGSLTHTAINAQDQSLDSSPWLEVDLGIAQPIGDVSIYNRTECCSERISNSLLELSLDPCDSALRRLVRADPVFVQTKKALETVTYAEAPTARYICLRKPGYAILSVAEIVVHGGEPLRNIAPLGKPRQFGPSEPLRGPEYALDGRTTLTSNLGMIADAGRSKTNVWWELDFGAVRPVDVVALWFPTNWRKMSTMRLNLQLSLDPCDNPQRRLVQEVGVSSGDDAATNPLNRFGYSPPKGTSARYVCVVSASMSSVIGATLMLAEVQVFGPADDQEFAALNAAAMASSAASLAPKVAAPSVAVQGEVSTAGTEPFAIEVGYGPLKAPVCKVTPTAADHASVQCGPLTMAMTGKVAGASDYALVSDDSYSFADLAAKAPFPAVLAPALAALSPALGSGKVRLALSNERGFYVTGIVDLASVGSATAVTSALTKANGFLAAYIPGYQAKPAFELVPTYSNGSLQLALRMVVIDTCTGPAELPATGTGLKFNKGALVFTVGVGPSGPTVSGGFESAAFIKPTKKDPWLLYRPNLDLGSALDSSSLTLKGSVTGACPEQCALSCSCSAQDCNADWHPLGLSEVSLRNGHLELGVSTAAQAVPIPVLSLAFDQAKLASLTGTVALVFDYPAKAFALRLAANKAPALAVLGLFGSVSGISLGDLAIDRPVVSFASAPTKVFTTDIPAGVRIKGGVNVSAVGLRGEVDSTLTPSASPNLEALVNADASTLAALIPKPSGNIRFLLDSSKTYDLVLNAPGLQYARPMFERGFWISTVELGVGLGATGAGQAQAATAKGSVNFRVLGIAQSAEFSVSAALDPSELAKALAQKVVGIVGPGGVMAAAFTKAAADLEAASKAAAAAMASGGRVAYNGVVTAGTVVGKTAAQASKAAGNGVVKAYEAFTGAVGL